jgi:hypothetical protein
VRADGRDDDNLLDWADAKAEKDIAYYEVAYAKDVERAEQRTAWVRALRDSLKVADAA